MFVETFYPLFLHLDYGEFIHKDFCVGVLEMADNEEVGESNACGNDWEVVSLTESTYAAAPGPAEVELKDNDKDGGIADILNLDKAETSSGLILSRHFALHPTQHENRPLEISEIDVLANKDKDDVASVDAEQCRSSGQDETDWTFKGLSASDDFPGLHFLDEKSVGLSIHGSAFEEGEKGLQGLTNLTAKEQSVYGSAALSPCHSDAASGVPRGYVETMTVSKAPETSESAADSSADISHQPKQIKGEKFSRFHLPCGAWWKSRAASFYCQAKEANAFWSVFIAAAMMGLVIHRQRQPQEKWQVLQLRWHLSIKNEVWLVVMSSPWSKTEIFSLRLNSVFN